MKNVPWWAWVVGALVIVVALGVGVLLGQGLDGDQSGPEPPVTGEETQTPGPDEPGTEGPVSPDEQAAGDGETTLVRVYLTRGEHLGVAGRTIPATRATARAAMEQLLSGPSVADQGYGLGTAIPAGTKLLGLTIEGGTARVDLSKEFGAGGGTLSVTMRLAQVVYTLTQFPSVERVVFLMEGSEVDVFTGQGIILSSPQTRADYEYVLPALFVEGPLPGAAVSSPIRVWGTGNTFEASFMVRVLDVEGAIVVEQPGMATSGSGTRGTFDLTVSYPNAAKPAATVVVFEYSAKDGSVTNAVEIPVTMAR